MTNKFVVDDKFIKHDGHCQSNTFVLSCEFCRGDLTRSISYAESKDPDYNLVLAIVKDDK